MQDNTRSFNMDCMDFMSEVPDKYYDLAIVDPPYGIGAGSEKFINGNSKTHKPFYKKNDWDTAIPNEDYFKELKRVSKNQIIWGGNYFAHYLGSFRCFICWDKTIHGNSYADCELAWTSFDQVARYYRKNIAQVTIEGRIHPTQKAVTLYAFCLKEFANQGDKILDTHGGSQSHRIACFNMGFALDIIELDKEYFDEGNMRFENHKKQLRLF